MRRALFTVLVLAGCATSPRPFNEPLLSVAELLANPDRYQGKTIFVEGFAVVGKKSKSLCPDQLHASEN